MEENELFSKQDNFFSNLEGVWIISTIIFGFLALFLGMYGFWFQLDVYSFQQSLYATFRLFSLNVDVPVGSVTPLSIKIAKWLALISVFSSIIQVLFNMVIEKLKLVYIRYRGNHEIVCGLNEHSVLFVKEQLAKGKKLIIIESNKNNRFINSLKSRGAVVIIGDPSDQDILTKANPRRAANFIAFYKLDTLNINVIMAFQRLLQEEKRPIKPKKVIVHLIDKQLENIFNQLENEVDRNYINLRLFNIHENSAKRLFDKHPLYESPLSSKQQDHLLIIGLGSTGENVLLQAAKIGHFPAKDKLKITVVDKQADYLASWFRLRYPGVDQCCQLSFVQKDVNTEEFKKYIIENANSFTYVSICIEGDQSCLVSAINVMHNLKDIPIAIKMSQEVTLANWIDSNPDQFRNLYRFGSADEVASHEVIIEEELDILAKAIHQSYLDKNGGDSWYKLDRFLKDSNRAQADHIDTKLNYMNLRRVPKSEVDSWLTYDQFLEIAKQNEITLGRAEHRRWNAFYFVNGWTQGAAEVWKDRENLKHCCLVEWDELDYVSKVQSEVQNKDIDFKQNDLNAIRDIPRVLKQLDEVIVKVGE